MKRISLTELEQKYKSVDYKELYQTVLQLIEQEKIKPVKASGKNGKKPALYKEYWILEKQKDYSEYVEELSYCYVSAISTDYYFKHLEQYGEDRKWLLLLNDYLKNREKELMIPMSVNERSFAIWHREKFLKEEAGRKLLKRCGITIDRLKLYETTEPLAYYAHKKSTPQNILIIENKDTFYSMRRALLSGEDQILGMEIGTLIYGAGKGIIRSFQDFHLCSEPYMRDERNRLYYFGDMDYEGIAIYEGLVRAFEKSCQIKPFCRAYQRMLYAAEQVGYEQLPVTKEGQNPCEGDLFFEFFTEEEKRQMRIILEKRRYIPQEILNIEDFGEARE